jgi:hypothetical protein
MSRTQMIRCRGQFIYKPQKELMLDRIILTVSNFAEAVACLRFERDFKLKLY